MVTSCCISVRSMLPRRVLRHAGGQLAPASQCCPRRCAACRNTPVALTGARGASCRAWSERLEARGCRSTLRRMRAAKAARQATGIVATRSPLLQLCFANRTPVGYNRRRKFGRGVRRSKKASEREVHNFSFFFPPQATVFLYYLRVRYCVGAVRILVSLAPSRGGAPPLGETQSVD